MSWPIEMREEVAVVTMTSQRSVVLQDEAFIVALGATFDQLDADYPLCPVVLTGQGNSFCGGLNFESVWSLLASGDSNRIESFFEAYRAMNVRLWSYPRPTVAAVNGHAFAGGLLLALACDYRVCAREARLALNEVPIGIPMPAAYVEIIRYAVGTAAASVLTLLGQEVDAAEAHRLGVAHAVEDAGRVVDRASEVARTISADAMACYAFTKRALQRDTQDRISGAAAALDRDLLNVITGVDARRARARRYREVKKKPPSWASGSGD